MPLFEARDDELVPFRRVKAGLDLYEKEIEELLWHNLEAFVGEPLFPVARQAAVGGGLRPDIVALDSEGHVHVIEVKRHVDRSQLAQCLEYAGWAHDVSLDDLAGMFHDGPEIFFSAWCEFTDTDAPRLVRRPPCLILAAGGFDSRTDAALGYLTESDLAIAVLRVTVYEDQEGRRFVDVDAEHEPEFASTDDPLGGQTSGSTQVGGRTTPTRYEIDGRRVLIRDLLDAELLEPDAMLIWNRPRSGVIYRATVLPGGAIRLADGREFSAPSRAADEAVGFGSFDGWRQWRVEDGRSLAGLRQQLLEQQSQSS